VDDRESLEGSGAVLDLVRRLGDVVGVEGDKNKRNEVYDVCLWSRLGAVPLGMVQKEVETSSVSERARPSTQMAEVICST
jgi:hypothetical protein